MTIPGRKPKTDGSGKSTARHRNKPTFQWTEVPNVPFTGGPKLPPASQLLNARRWPPRTRAWWKAVSAMPHCLLWGPSDWQYAIDAALIAAEFHEGELRAAAPLERRERVMGTTLEYRRDLRIRYIDPPSGDDEAGDGAEVSRLDDYRGVYDDDGGDSPG